MSYQVLARKWRPKSFDTLVGQEHVVRALSHALATGRLHHAWLFTGTRGVGKTTIARILAKALNCETGVSATPCGQCDACRAIDADRFPDYVEMDAASNRGVDDMAALLDRAVYAPVAGRYKVYMIDEVHMLTGHAFNAMLKTLEEPPEHVKFILATTDPQKIPVTVLSRCLQFNLKQMPPVQIVDHLARILAAEAVPFERGALRHLAHAASGSMRDALSLLDQAIAHGAGKVVEEQVTNMLGTVGDDHLFAIFDALAAGDADALIAVADGMEARSLSFNAALQALASLLARVALVQFAPAAVADEHERTLLAAHAARFDAEYLQLAYQIAIHGRDELALAPDEYTGFTMSLLRLLAFRPEQPPALGSPALPGGGGSGGRARPLPAASPKVAETAGNKASPAPVATPVPAATSNADKGDRPRSPAPEIAHPTLPARNADVPPWESLPPEAMSQTASEAPTVSQQWVEETAEAVITRASAPEAPATATQATGEPGKEAAVTAAFAQGDWREVVRALGLSGLARELAQHCEWIACTDDRLNLRLSDAYRHLLDINRVLIARIEEDLSRALGRPLKLHFEVGAIAGQTPAQRDEIERQVRRAQAVAALAGDPFVRELIERFDASLSENTVKLL
jgi:DNA polymerase-3 subunit gamma/tau